MMSSVLPHAHMRPRSTSESWPGLRLCVFSCFCSWLLSRFNRTSLASRLLTIPSFLPFSFLASFLVSSSLLSVSPGFKRLATGDSPVTCVLSTTWILFASTFSSSLNNSWQRAAGLVCTLGQCSGISEPSSGRGAHYTEPDVGFLQRSRHTNSTQHPARYAEWDYHGNHILHSQSPADGMEHAVDQWRVISKGGGCDDGRAT